MTEDKGMIVSQHACTSYLENQVAELLLNPAVLSSGAHYILLADVDQVFTETDNSQLQMMPTKEEVSTVLFISNLNAEPGTDGITSLLYHEHWNALGDNVHEVFHSSSI